MYLTVENSDVSFKIEGRIVIARKLINRRFYKIEKELTTNSIDYLWKVLANLENLPEEFWKLDYT